MIHNDLTKRKLRDLKGLGPKSEQLLLDIGIQDTSDFISRDAFDIYAQLKSHYPNTSLNFLYAIIGAQTNQHWQEIAQDRRTEILLRLDELGLAPK